jgi:hypothetical protein
LRFFAPAAKPFIIAQARRLYTICAAEIDAAFARQAVAA